MSTILVTGGAGYIGSHVALALKERGHKPILLDNLSRGHRDIVERAIGEPVIVADTRDAQALEKLFAKQPIDAVMHFAAFIEVGESVKDPLSFYDNNVHGSITLLRAMQKAGINHFIFSSTCATYGTPIVVPIAEDHPQHPLSPYGQTKLVVERIHRGLRTSIRTAFRVFSLF
jgi:UDP-glucose 4-epimerase